MRKKIAIGLFLLFFAFSAEANCNNGVDDDGDGLVDWQYDLGCYGPEDSGENAATREEEDGWTTFNLAPGARVIYVSNSEGNDEWSGLSPFWNGTDGPKKTVAAGKALVRANSSDWLLFRRGDVWRDESLGYWSHYNGASTEFPIVVASYGESKVRPKFEHSTGWLSGNANLSKVAFVGLHAYAYQRDPKNPYFTGKGYGGVSILAKGGDLLFEDCKIEYAQLNIQDYEGVSTEPFTLRRNILTHSYSLSSHAQSIYTHVSAPLILEENLFHHGGWNDEFRLALWAANGDYAAWKAIHDGVLAITVYDQELTVTNLNFSAVNNMTDVARVIENGINGALSADPVTFSWTQGGSFILKTDDFPSDSTYFIRPYSGIGTDISRENFLNATNGTANTNQGAPESTIFNRNRYLSGGKGNTILRRNIDANGASGGVQIREGGIVENELFLQNPISIVIGHAQNSPNFNVSGKVFNNVILGNRNIDTQNMGTGIWIESNLASDSYGPSFIENLEVHNNIIAHATNSTGNIRGIYFGGSGPHINLDIHHNVIYDWTRRNWPNPNDHRASGVGIGALNSESQNVRFHDNIIKQPESGFIMGSYAASAGLIQMKNNRYFGVEPDPPTIWSKGLFEIGSSVSSADWISRMQEENVSLADIHFNDANRNIGAYMASLGETASYDAFIEKALAQSKYAWDTHYTAAVVNDWIRAGFFSGATDSTSPSSPQGLSVR